MKQRAKSRFQEIQSQIIDGLRELDPEAKLKTDEWNRSGGGGGRTCVLENGAIFEKGGVNFSEVWGELPAEMAQKLVGKDCDLPFYATGTSLVIHPYSPMVPTVHANVRYLEVEDRKWIGGGADLTPYYFYEEDAVHFHKVMKDVCDSVDESYYSKFKPWCDEYFFLKHRGEARGIGGLFFDYLGKDDPENIENYFSLASSLGGRFCDAYLPIVSRRKAEQFSEQQKHFQLIRRGRYVEFNLIWDRGTLFGLRTNGRAESILMSLPAEVRWEYDFEIDPGSREAELIEVLTSPREWI